MILKAIYDAANNLGTRVVLDGAGGDVILSEGSYITRLIRKGRLRLAMAEIAAENRFWLGGSFASDLFHYGRAAIVPETVKKRLRGLRRWFFPAAGGSGAGPPGAPGEAAG